MSILEIEVQFKDEDVHTSRVVVLEGVRFRLDTYTNKQDNTWYMDLYDDQDVPLVQGLALVVGLDLLFPYRYKNVPPGILFVNDQSGVVQDPNLESFSKKEAALYYQTSE